MKRHQHIRTEYSLTKLSSPRKGTPNRRVIAKYEDSTREYFLHATKGYRSSKKQVRSA